MSSNDIDDEQLNEDFEDVLGNDPEMETQAEEEALQEEQYEVPDKFKGKDVSDVVKSYQELEREFGRRNNEVGELRKLTDDLLQLQLKQKPVEEERKQVDIDTLLENPDGVVSSMIKDNPEIKQLREQLTEMKRDSAKKKFEQKHPNYMDVIGSQNFQKWVGESNLRKQLLSDAHYNYNYDTADELISLYEQVNSGNAEAAAQKRKSALKKADSVKGAGSGSSKKVFRRADLLKLAMTNRDKYDAMYSEIALAYKEGRVR